jgi:hypothetical protein
LSPEKALCLMKRRSKWSLGANSGHRQTVRRKGQIDP